MIWPGGTAMRDTESGAGRVCIESEFVEINI